MGTSDREPRRPRTATHHRDWRTLREFIPVRYTVDPRSRDHGHDRWGSRPRWRGHYAVTFLVTNGGRRNGVVMATISRSALTNALFLRSDPEPVE